MVIKSLDTSPFFTAFVFLLWLGFPLLMALSGFLLHNAIIAHSLCGRFSKAVSFLVLAVSLATGVITLCSVYFWIRDCTLLPVIPSLILSILSVAWLLYYWAVHKKTIWALLAIPLLFTLLILGLIFLYLGYTYFP